MSEHFSLYSPKNGLALSRMNIKILTRFSQNNFNLGKYSNKRVQLYSLLYNSAILMGPNLPKPLFDLKYVDALLLFTHYNALLLENSRTHQQSTMILEKFNLSSFTGELFTSCPLTRCGLSVQSLRPEGG